MYTITLNDYEVANLRALIEACGYGKAKRVERNPLWAANTGDWIGQIYNLLPIVAYPPNADADKLAQEANKYLIDRNVNELQNIRQIVQEWLDQQGHDRCWYYPELFSKLANVLNLTPKIDPALPTRQEFEEGCRKFQDEEYEK